MKTSYVFNNWIFVKLRHNTKLLSSLSCSFDRDSHRQTLAISNSLRS